MYIWRCSIAMILGLVWYFSDCGRTVTQYLVFFLSCLSTPLLFRNIGQESSTQTDEVFEETLFEESNVDDGLLGYDVPDTEIDTRAEIPLELQYPHVKKSLQQVIECAYAQLVLPWYCVPEPLESQPLHHVLCREFDFVIDKVISRVKDLDVCSAIVGCVRILTQHLHNAKQSDREPLFSSRAEEVAVLRVFSEALVRNLFPESLVGLDVNRCALIEIVALKALELLVTWLSDPDNLNHLVVSQLDSGTPKSSVEELCESDSDQSSTTSQEAEGEGSGLTSEGTENSICSRTKLKKKANKLKEGLSKFLDKIKSKKAKKRQMKKMEQELMFRAMSSQADLANEDHGSSREGSIRTQQDSDDEDSDLDNYLTSVQQDMMEFKLSYEMWRVSHWSVSIPHAEWENEELILTIHLEERDNPENLHWDVKKTHMDVIYFRNRWQDSTNLPMISVLDESSENVASDEIKEEARASVEVFLQELLSDDLIGHTQPVFQFLCPLDRLLSEEQHYGGVWGLLSSLAYFLTPGQEEEEHNSPHVEAKTEDLNSPHPETEVLTVSEASNEKCDDMTDASLPTINITQSDPPSEPSEEEATADKEPQPSARLDSSSNDSCSQDKTEDVDSPLSHLKMMIKGLSRSRSQESLALRKATNDEDQTDSDCVPHSSQNGGSPWDLTDGPSWLLFVAKSCKKEKVGLKISCGLHKAKRKDQGTLSQGEEPQKKDQTSWEQLEATKAIFDLLKEISGNSILLNIFDAILKPVMPILKKKVNSFLNKMNPTEVQMAAYIDNMREKQWPEGSPAVPRPPRSSEEKNETRDRAHHFINTRYSNYLILKKTDMETVFKLFQDSEENKKLVYMLLSFLLREFLPDEDALNVSAMALQKVNNCNN